MKNLKIRIHLASGKGYVDAKVNVPEVKNKEESKKFVNQIVEMCKKQIKDQEIYDILVDYNRINKYSSLIYLCGKTLHEDCLYIPTVQELGITVIEL